METPPWASTLAPRHCIGTVSSSCRIRLNAHPPTPPSLPLDHSDPAYVPELPYEAACIYVNGTCTKQCNTAQHSIGQDRAPAASQHVCEHRTLKCTHDSMLPVTWYVLAMAAVCPPPPPSVLSPVGTAEHLIIVHIYGSRMHTHRDVGDAPLACNQCPPPPPGPGLEAVCFLLLLAQLLLLLQQPPCRACGARP